MIGETSTAALAKPILAVNAGPTKSDSKPELNVNVVLDKLFLLGNFKEAARLSGTSKENRAAYNEHKLDNIQRAERLYTGRLAREETSPVLARYCEDKCDYVATHAKDYVKFKQRWRDLTPQDGEANPRVHALTIAAADPSDPDCTRRAVNALVQIATHSTPGEELAALSAIAGLNTKTPNMIREISDYTNENYWGFDHFTAHPWDAPVTRLLIDSLKDEDINVRLAGLNALGRHTQRFRRSLNQDTALKRLLENNVENTEGKQAKLAAIKLIAAYNEKTSLIYIGPDRQATQVADYLHSLSADSDAEVRTAAAHKFPRNFKSKTGQVALNRLTAIVQYDPDANTRKTAVRVLGDAIDIYLKHPFEHGISLSDPDIVPYIDAANVCMHALLSDPNASVRASAAEALEIIVGRRNSTTFLDEQFNALTGLLVKALKDNDASVRLAALNSLNKKRSGALSKTRMQLLSEDPDPEVRQTSAMQLAEEDYKKHPAILKALARALDDSQPSVALQAADALADKEHSKVIVEQLSKKILSDEAPLDIRVACLEALARNVRDSIDTQAVVLQASGSIERQLSSRALKLLEGVRIKTPSVNSAPSSTPKNKDKTTEAGVSSTQGEASSSGQSSQPEASIQALRRTSSFGKAIKAVRSAVGLRKAPK